MNIKKQKERGEGGGLKGQKRVTRDRSVIPYSRQCRRRRRRRETQVHTLIHTHTGTPSPLQGAPHTPTVTPDTHLHVCTPHTTAMRALLPDTCVCGHIYVQH